MPFAPIRDGEWVLSTLREATHSTRWGYLAAAWALVFAALHFYWALGGEAGLASSAGSELAATRPLWFVLAGLWGVGSLLVAGACLAIMMTRRHALRSLRWLVVVAGWAVSLLLLLRGVGLEVLLLGRFYDGNTALTPSQVHVSLVLWNPWFILGGLAFAMASLAGTSRSS